MWRKLKIKELKTIGSLSHFIGDPSAEFGVDHIWRVGDGGVLEAIRLLAILCLLQKETTT